MGRINNQNYIQISGWMINELHLKGNELLVYALIHGFSQDGKSVFCGGISYIGEWISGTDHTVVSCLKSLIEKNLVSKRVTQTKGSVKYVEYWTTKSREKLNPATANSTVESEDANFHHCKNYSRTTANSTVATTAKFAVNNNILNSSLKNSSSSSLFENSESENKIKKPEEEKESGIKKIIQDIFGNSNALTPDFEKRLDEFFKKNGLKSELIENYLKYVWNLCERKKPENISSYFFKSALNNMTVMNFTVSQKNAAQEEKEKLFCCPVCGEHHQVWERCPNCGLEIAERGDEEACDFRRKEFALPKEKRDEIKKELLDICKKYLGDNSPDRIIRQKADTMALYRRYGLISGNDGLEENDFRSMA